MLCSKCREEVKPVVALDIDGTMGDFHTHFLKFATGYLYGKPSLSPPVFDGRMPMRQWFCDVYGVGEDVWRDIKLAYRQGGMKRTMPSRGFGGKLAEACHRVGAEVWVTTTRPYLRLDNIDPDTRFWLEKEGVEYDGLIYDERKYRTLAKLVGPERVVAVLEDLPEEFMWAAGQFGNGVPILFRDHHNLWFQNELQASQMAHSGEAAWQRIQSRIQSWQGLAHDAA